MAAAGVLEAGSVLKVIISTNEHFIDLIHEVSISAPISVST